MGPTESSGRKLRHSSYERTVITVKEIKGACPVYRPGHKIVLDEGHDNIDTIKTHALKNWGPPSLKEILK